MRLRDLDRSELDDAQKKVYDNIAQGPRGNVRGPFAVMLRCPELTDRVQKLGEYLRFGSSLPPRLSEFAIIITAREWSSEIEWVGHSKLAVAGGLSAQVVEDLRVGRRPQAMQDDEAALYNFCIELHRDKEVSDTTYDAALKHFGEKGLVDLMGISGYYTLAAMMLKVSQKPLPEGTPNALPKLK